MAAETATFDEFKDSYYASYVTNDQRKDAELFESALNNENKSDRHQIFDFLVAQGLDVTGVNSEGTGLLHLLAYRIDRNEGGDVELFRKLLSWGCDPNQFSRRLGSPFDAINRQTGCLDAILMPFFDLLLQYGFDVCSPGLSSKTPLESVREMVSVFERLGTVGDYRKTMLARLEELTEERCG